MLGSRTSYSRTYALTVTILLQDLLRSDNFFEGTERFGFNGLLFQLSGYFQIVTISESVMEEKYVQLKLNLLKI